VEEFSEINVVRTVCKEIKFDPEDFAIVFHKDGSMTMGTPDQEIEASFGEIHFLMCNLLFGGPPEVEKMQRDLYDLVKIVYGSYIGI
jgi:hypothetical protein